MDIKKVSGDAYTNYYEIVNPKTYSTYERACRFGQVKRASAIEIDSQTRFIALPPYDAFGRANVYVQSSK